MTIYTPRRLRPGQILAWGLRGLAGLLGIWPLLLIAAFLISPVGPHLRWEYSYQQRGAYRHFLACEYLGSRGFVQYVRYGECPLLTIIDRRELH